MHKRLLTALATAGLLSGLVVASAVAQEGEHKKMSSEKAGGSSMAGKNMSEQEAMDKMSSMSVDDKAAMFDK